MLTLRGFISDYAKGFGGKHGVQANSQDAVSNRQQFYVFVQCGTPNKVSASFCPISPIQNEQIKIMWVVEDREMITHRPDTPCLQ